MAAYAALLSLSKVIHLTLLSEEQKYTQICSKEQMMSLHQDIGRLQQLLEDLSGRSHPSIDLLESRIRDAAYRMEDIIEENSHIIEDHIPSMEDHVPSIEYHSPSNKNGSHRSLFARFTRFLCMRSTAVERTTSPEATTTSPEAKTTSPDATTTSPSAFGGCALGISVLLKETMEMKENNLQEKVISGAPHPLTTTTSSIQGPAAKLGLIELPVEIMNRIFRGGSNLEIVPLTGMGGIGKTTLARAVYQHPKTLRHFDIFSWVTVSQEFNVKEILRALLPDEQHSEPDERLIELVHKRLIGRRFLIVLDDMWDGKAWDGIRNAFPDDNKGSRIILTTRLLDVAAHVGSSDHVHQMQLLNDEQSWTLLREKVDGIKQWTKKLEDLGRRISRNCRGLPLAIVTIGGLLKFTMREEYWEQVARNTNSEAAANYDDHLFDILALSYTNLPPYLKPCFLYFGSYKEDQEIPTKELVRLWTVEGFLKPSGSKEMEDVAEEYLEELVARNLVLVKEKRPGGRIKTCGIHDVLRDLSIRKAHEEKFAHHITESSSLMDRYSRNDLRRGTIDRGCFTQPLVHHTHVRSLRFDEDEDVVSVIQHLMLIRVLDSVPIFENSQLSILYQLTNLRYLHINLDSYQSRDGRTITVCESICKLQNLEILIFSNYIWTNSDAYNLILPFEIWEMPRLRHLITFEGSRLPCPALNNKVSCLGLQTLGWVTHFVLTRSMTSKLSNLEKLKLHYNLKIEGEKHDKIQLDSLVHLHQLEELNIKCKMGTEVCDFSFPHKLKKLSLMRTLMPVEKMSAIGSLPNLEVLKLKDFAVKGKVWEPIEGEFLQLKYLKMHLLRLEEWRAESEHFPQLETLIIRSCDKLKEVPAGIGEINTLRKLHLKNCRAAEESVEEIKAEQESLCNDLLQVTIIRW